MQKPSPADIIMREALPNLEKMRFRSKMLNAVYDALFICDIENDKIPADLKSRLDRSIDELIPEQIPLGNPEIPSTDDKLSITHESLKALHEKIMGTIVHAFSQLGLADAGKSKTLDEAVTAIIQNEKSHRDAEIRR